MQPEINNMPSSSNPIRAIAGVLAATLVIAVIVVILVHGSKHQASDGKIQVVAAENFWGNIAAQIGGNEVDVTSIITDPSADPHLYESDARDASAVGNAQLVIENGLGYDDFIDKLLNAHSAKGRATLSAEKILKVTGPDPNPHLWYDTPRIKDMAAAIELRLTVLDPVHQSIYQHNLAQFEASLQPLLDLEATIKQKYVGTPVAYTERVPGYLLGLTGLNVKTPDGFARAIEDGNDPSPADTTAMDALITTHGIKVLLYNSQATSPAAQHARDLAQQSGIPVIGVTETLPKGESKFQGWQLDQAKALLAALGG